jgi:hypothetical protein
VSTQQALWEFGELRRDLHRAANLGQRLEIALGRLVAPPRGVASAQTELVGCGIDELVEELGQTLVQCGADLGKIERCLAQAAAIRRTGST